MMLARVVGEVVATTKHAYLTGQKLLLVLPVDPDGNPVGRVQIAVDCAQAGPGDHVRCSTRAMARRRCSCGRGDPRARSSSGLSTRSLSQARAGTVQGRPHRDRLARAILREQ